MVRRILQVCEKDKFYMYYQEMYDLKMMVRPIMKERLILKYLWYIYYYW